MENVSASTITSTTTTHNNVEAVAVVCLRPLANFQPALWQDTFLDYTPLDEVYKRQTKEEIEELKEVVRKELVSDDKDPKERLMYIDYIDRLGVAYHFEHEIEQILLHFHTMHYNDDSYKNDLHYVSLRFRILRQHGFRVSSDVFDNVWNNNEKESFKNYGVEAILSMYEASHLAVHGEVTLDEAMTYTRERLVSFANDLKCPMARQVAHALELPLFRRSPRLESRFQISFYGSHSSQHDHNLLKLAILDFNLVQSLHQKELSDILKWSKELELKKKVAYARNRIVEGKVWILGVYGEPKYSYARVLCNKLFQVACILDDTYDAFGVFHELQIFTDAIQRWDRSCVSQLPDCMKYAYDVIANTCDEFKKELANQGRSYAADYFRLQLQGLCRSYMVQAKWCHEKYVPTYDEYMRNGIESSGYSYVHAASFAGMGSIANEDAFEWITRPSSKAVKASCVLARILNDICSHKFERNRGHNASAVECYMKQFDVTEKEAYEQLYLIVENAWKDIIEDMFRPTDVPMPVFTRVLNLSRTLYDVYGIGEDAYTMNQFMQPQIEAILKNPIM